MGKKPASMVIGIVLVLSLLCVKEAPAMDFPDPTGYYTNNGVEWVPVTSTHGDFYSYSLPVLDNLWSNGIITGGSFYVPSAPGQVDPDYMYIYTGANGHLANNDLANIDDAYDSASGEPDIFGTNTATLKVGSTTYTYDPGPLPFAPQFNGDSLYSWDIKVNTLNTFLQGSDLMFFFANNEPGGENIKEPGDLPDDNLYAWGRVTLVDLSNPANNAIFDFNSSGIGVYAFNSTNAAPANSDYVLSGSSVYIPDFSTAALGDLTLVKHNIGANNAAYAVYSPELNVALSSGLYDVMQGDFRMRDIANGYEQLFIMRGNTTPPPPPVVPEPATMLLLGLGVSGLLFNGVRPRHLTKR